MTVLDAYDVRARAMPGLLMLLSVVFTGLGFGVGDYPLMSTIVSVLAGSGGAAVLSGFAGERGRAVQPDLWTSWGGPPVERALLEQTSTGQDRRERLTKVVGMTLTPDQTPSERARVVKALFRVTDDRDNHPLVFEANWRYGFFRNLYGLRRIGQALSAGSVLVLGGALLLDLGGTMPGELNLSTGAVILTLAGNTLLTAFWFVYPTEARVRDAAERLRDRLLETLDVLSAETDPACPV